MTSIDRSLGGEVSHDGDFMIFEGNRYSRKGFLFKSFAMSAVVSDGGMACPDAPRHSRVDAGHFLLTDHRRRKAHPVRTGEV